MKKIFLYLLFISAFTACKNDKTQSSIDETTEGSQIQTETVETDETMATTSAVARDNEATMTHNPNDGQDHSGHNHAKPAAVQNNTQSNTQKSALTKDNNHMGNAGKVTPAGYVDGQGLLVPSACSFLDVDFLAKALNVSSSIIDVKDASTPDQKNSSSCFFKWSDEYLGNAGVMAQVMTNPIYDEYPEWITQFLNTKRVDGEQDYTTTNELYKYKDWKELGDDGAYCAELGKYHWRLGNDYLFLLAFNLDITPQKQKELAKTIGAKIMENFNIKVKR